MAAYSIEQDIRQALLPVVRDCWEMAGLTELSEGSLVGSWDTAAVDHFKSITPRAYMRTGALTTISPVSGRVMKVGTSNDLFFTDVLFRITDENSSTWHREVQTTLESKGKEAKNRVKYPKSWEPLTYPFRRNPSSNEESLGVSGSWFEQKHDYLQYYLFAGPNVNSSPRVYRNLGGADGQDPTRGLDLFNRWMKNTGLQTVSALPKDGSNKINASLSFRTNTDMDRLMERASRFLAGAITITADFTPYRLELE